MCELHPQGVGVPAEPLGWEGCLGFGGWGQGLRWGPLGSTFGKTESHEEGPRAGVRGDLGPPSVPGSFSKMNSAIAPRPWADTGPREQATKCREDGEGGSSSEVAQQDRSPGIQGQV